MRRDWMRRGWEESTGLWKPVWEEPGEARLASGEAGAGLEGPRQLVWELGLTPGDVGSPEGTQPRPPGPGLGRQQ